MDMELHTFKNVSNCLNANVYSYLETSGGQSSNSYLNVVHFIAKQCFKSNTHNNYNYIIKTKWSYFK
jgi:hypothetical protein